MAVDFGFDEAWRERIARAHATAADALQRACDPQAGWTGELSASALSTATAVTALAVVARHDPARPTTENELIRRGCTWLVRHQNADGGWGDTTRSFSNLSTTALVWAALGFAGETDSGRPELRDSLCSAERWLERAAGSLAPAQLVDAIERRYGSDRTFSIPILTLCAVCGRLGPGPDGWRHVRQLPFELAALPQAWFGALRLPVVSYALPALIAIGQVRHGLRPTRNPFTRWLRHGVRARTLRKLIELQPPNGGFLEATPLTSFVTLSLAALGLTSHPVVQRGVAFLRASVRADGSWPIDTNLATWLTTLSLNALPGGSAESAPPATEQSRLRDWLLRQQYRNVHAYTRAAPGGWAWTDLPGGVPDADDTAGAVLALARLDPDAPSVRTALDAGVTWLLDLQNRDGGIPTFCRGWGTLPFDRSSPDITAHAIRAWLAARDLVSPRTRARVAAALPRARRFLLRRQQPDGTWIPLWFGHQQHPREENPLYGTSRVLLALVALEEKAAAGVLPALDRALRWFEGKQNHDGGWSGAPGAASSLEETGLALESLAALGAAEGIRLTATARSRLESTLRYGSRWLADAVERRAWDEPAPIGFYFAKLWYFERLYPLVFATGALTKMTRLS